MKNYEYQVTFSTGEKENVIAKGIKDAVIIARGEQLKKGNRDIVISTHQVR